TAGVQTVSVADVTDSNKGGDTGTATTVNAGALAKIQLLMPGESAAPGTTSGKTGTPGVETAGTAYNVTVNAVDTNWNLVSTNDTIKITSTDPNAGIATNAALAAGTKAFSITNKTAGTWTMTASNMTHSAIGTNTSPSFTVVPGAVAKL